MSNWSKAIVMSDLHLAAADVKPSDIDTLSRLNIGIDHINTYHQDAEIVIFAGDISDDGSDASYELFLQAVSKLSTPWVATLGNHDNRKIAAKYLESNSETGRFDHVITLSKGKLIVLDTAVDNEDHGALTEKQLSWLDSQLSDELTLVTLHHPPQRLGIWTDTIALQDQQKLFETLAPYSNSIQILAGHVHMMTAGIWNGLSVCTLSGNHFSVAPVLEDEPRETSLKRNFLNGPAEYCLVLFQECGMTLHMQAYDLYNAPFDKKQVQNLVEPI